jgi:hypothetical protein
MGSDLHTIEIGIAAVPPAQTVNEPVTPTKKASNKAKATAVPPLGKADTAGDPKPPAKRKAAKPALTKKASPPVVPDTPAKRKMKSEPV